MLTSAVPFSQSARILQRELPRSPQQQGSVLDAQSGEQDWVRTLIKCSFDSVIIPSQDDVPTPPGGTLGNGTACVTRNASISLGFRSDIIPLNWTLLPTASASNNLASFPGGEFG